MAYKSDNTHSSHRTPIIVAIIGLVGVLTTALFTNWDKIFKKESGERPAAVASQAVAPPISSPAQLKPGEVVIDLAGVNTATAPGYFVAAGPYLLDYGIHVTDTVPAQSKLIITNNLALYAGTSLHPTTTQNFLYQKDTDNAPASFKLLLKKPCQAFSFTIPIPLAATKSGISHPAWSAPALDNEGRELSSQSEGLRRSHSNVPSRTYTLESPGFNRIAAVRFDSDPRLNGKPFSAFSSIVIERLSMRCEDK